MLTLSQPPGQVLGVKYGHELQLPILRVVLLLVN